MKNKFKLLAFSVVLVLFCGCFKGVNSEEGKIVKSKFRESKISFVDVNGQLQKESVWKLNSNYFKIIDFFERKEIKMEDYINDPLLFRNWLNLNLTQKDIDELEQNQDKIWYWFMEKDNVVTIKAEKFKSKTKIVWKIGDYVTLINRSKNGDEQKKENYYNEIKRIEDKKANNEALTNKEAIQLSNHQAMSVHASNRFVWDSSKEAVENIVLGNAKRNHLNVVTSDDKLKWNSGQFFKIATLADVLNNQVDYIKKIKYYPSGRVMELPDVGGPDGPFCLEDKSYIEKIKKSLEIYRDEINKYKPDGDPQEVHFTFQYIDDMLVAENMNKNISTNESNELKKLKAELESQYKRLEEKETWHRYYYQSGRIKSEGELSKTKRKIKKWKFYYENGNIEAEGSYTENGLERVYDGNGYRVGTWKKYYESGELEALKTYNKVVEVKEYYKNGKLKSIGSYSYSGNQVGEWKTYHENGRLLSSGKYIDQGYMSFRIGTWNYYDKNGKLWRTETR